VENCKKWAKVIDPNGATSAVLVDEGALLVEDAAFDAENVVLEGVEDALVAQRARCDWKLDKRNAAHCSSSISSNLRHTNKMRPFSLVIARPHQSVVGSFVWQVERHAIAVRKDTVIADSVIRRAVNANRSACTTVEKATISKGQTAT